MILIYATFPDQETAQSISKALVEGRLVACANIFQPHQSIYWWDGKVESSAEIAVIFKTQEEHFESVKAKITALHPFEVPCVVALDIKDGHPEFLKWIGQETSVI